MSRRIIPTVLGKGQRFPEIGMLPTYWSLRVGLRVAMVLVGMSFSWLMSYSEWMVRLEFQWKLTHSPSWTYLVLISLCHVLELYYPFKMCVLSPSLLFHFCYHQLLNSSSPLSVILVGSSFLLAFFVHCINVCHLFIHQWVFQTFILLYQSHLFEIKKMVITALLKIFQMKSMGKISEPSAWSTEFSNIWPWLPFQMDDEQPSLLIIIFFSHKRFWSPFKTLHILSHSKGSPSLSLSVYTQSSLAVTQVLVETSLSWENVLWHTQVKLKSLSIGLFKHYLFHETHTLIVDSFFMVLSLLPIVLLEAAAGKGPEAETSNERIKKTARIWLKQAIFLRSDLIRGPY